MSTGVDYAWGRPNPAHIAAAGHKVVLRYLSRDPSKNLTPAERDALLAAGLDIVLVWEHTAGAALGGARQGTLDGQEAARQLLALGAPRNLAIYFAVDMAITPAQVPTVAAYFAAALRQNPGRNGGSYGSAFTTQAMLDGGHVKYGWQTTAWSGGVVVPQAALVQVGFGRVIDGVSCDLNVIQHEYGGWRPKPVAPSKKKPTIDPDPGGTVLVVIRSDAGGGLYLTDGITRRALVSQDDVTHAQALGAKLQTWPDAIVRAIPLVKP